MSTASTTSAYRALLRAQRATFKGDTSQLTNARTFTRREFEKNANVTEPETLAKLFKTADQAATIIRKNLVQGIRRSEDTFELRITKDTEVNDNLTIKGGSSSSGCQQRQPPQRI